jgi:hypothetical protein
MATPAPRWNPGETIVVRHVRREQVWFAHSAIVVEDTGERLVLFEPAGAIRQSSHFHFDSGQIDPPMPKARHSTDALIIMQAGAAHAVSLFWAEGGGPFLCWYVDLQKPFRRVSNGVTTWDQSLDIVVGPDLRWRWKDEDHLARLPQLGWMTSDEAAEVRREGLRVIDMIEGRQAPFNEDWPGWRPDPSWPTPALPHDWAAAC